jgi:hypothetical protein
MGSQHEDSAPAGESVNIPNGLDEERDEALRRFGKLGAYTAPTLLAILASEKAIAITGGCV